MPSFGSKSRSRLDTCHPKLVEVCENVILHYDFTVIWGFRGEDAQEDCFDRGTSTKHFPDSNHNFEPSIAMDAAPWHADAPHIRWENEREFVFLAGRMMMAADLYGTDLRWGGNWDMDQDLYDFNKPFDLGHFELV